jgi:hypothetical protein
LTAASPVSAKLAVGAQHRDRGLLLARVGRAQRHQDHRFMAVGGTQRRLWRGGKIRDLAYLRQCAELLRERVRPCEQRGRLDRSPVRLDGHDDRIEKRRIEVRTQGITDRLRRTAGDSRVAAAGGARKVVGAPGAERDGDDPSGQDAPRVPADVKA